MNIPKFEDKLSQTIFVFVLWFLLYIPSLGLLELDFDEHKRVMPAVSMLDTGEWIIPELAGRKYFNKPPLINWLIALSFQISGEKNEFFARLPSVLFVLAFSLLILFLKSSILNSKGKFATVLLFLTSFALWQKSRQAEIDASYTCLTGLATYIWINSFAGGKSKWFSWIASFAILGLGLLLKGPMILLFFYCVILSVLYFTGKTKDIFSLKHACGIVVMLSIFLCWGIFIFNYKSSNISGVPLNKGETSVIQTWGKELFLRFRDNMNPLKWFERVLSSIINFLPWLLLVPLLWNKKYIANISPEQKNIFLASRFGIVLSFALVCLIPGTRPRYSMPAFAFLTVLLGWIISDSNQIPEIKKIWKKTLSVLSLIVLIVANLAGLLLLLFFFFGSPFYGAELEKIVRVFNNNYVFITCLCTVIFANFAFFFVKRNFKRETDYICLLINSALIFTCISLFFANFAMPVMKLNECHRPAGRAISVSVPQNKAIYMFKVGSEHFLFYIPNKIRHIFTYKELPESAEYLLLQKEEYDENAAYPFFKDRGAKLLKEVKADKRIFALIQFTKSHD